MTNEPRRGTGETADWEPHRELLHGIQDLRREFGDFSVMASEIRIIDPSPEGVRQQLASLRARLTYVASASERG